MYLPIQKIIAMSFSNLFESGFKKRYQDHFASILKIAMCDGVNNEEKKRF